MLGFWPGALADDPWTDPAAARLASEVRTESRDALLGDGEDAPFELVERGTDERLRFEMARGGWSPIFVARPSLAVAVGDAVPDNAGGAEEPGFVTLDARAEAAAYLGPLVLWVEPGAQLALVGDAEARPTLRTAWVGAENGTFEAGFGKRERWLGPARHGALLLSGNASPPWLGTGSVEGRLPGKARRIGRFRAELGAGFLDRPRTDVERPGLLLMDLRWAPVPVFEIGATRLSLFGGVGRPAPDLGQLLLPTEPHVSEDPDQLLPDQNELASLDFRLTAPLRRWWGVPIDYVEAWWHYGGEDVIARELGPIPYPSLAGVGNLYGAEIAVAPVTVSVEYTRLLDDYFRWYVGHRVYHEGFTQDDRVMGHFGGPDSETWWGAVAVDREPWRARLWADHARRVGVVGALNDHVFTFLTEERTARVGLDLQADLPALPCLALGASWERVTGEGFVPGAGADRARVSVAVSGLFGTGP